MSLLRNITKNLKRAVGRRRFSDYSDAYSDAAIRDLVQSGDLVLIHPFPVEFGGVEGPLNAIYVPKAAAVEHRKLVQHLTLQFEEGLIGALRVEQRHKGASLVPSQINIIASLGEQLYPHRIEVW